MNFLNSLAPYAHWLVRLSLAGTFIYHGVSKFPPTAFIEFSGLPLIVGWAVAIGEVSAGACLIVGAVTKDLITRLGGLGVVIIMAGSYVEFSLMQKAMEEPGSGVTTRISALINCNDSIPMYRESASGTLSLPAAPKIGSAAEPDSLAGKLAANGLPVTVPFIYAVYKDAASKTHNVVYRGSADDVDTDKLKDFEFVP